MSCCGDGVGFEFHSFLSTEGNSWNPTLESEHDQLHAVEISSVAEQMQYMIHGSTTYLYA